MSNTNLYDALTVIFYMSGMVALFGIAAWLVTKGHHWFGLLVLLIASSIKVKTGS